MHAGSTNIDVPAPENHYCTHSGFERSVLLPDDLPWHEELTILLHVHSYYTLPDVLQDLHHAKLQYSCTKGGHVTWDKQLLRQAILRFGALLYRVLQLVLRYISCCNWCFVTNGNCGTTSFDVQVSLGPIAGHAQVRSSQQKKT
jgi:hypothetical protein